MTSSTILIRARSEPSFSCLLPEVSTCIMLASPLCSYSKKFLDLSDDIFRRILSFIPISSPVGAVQQVSIKVFPIEWLRLRLVCQRFRTLQHDRLTFYLDVIKTHAFSDDPLYRQRLLSLILSPTIQLYLSIDTSKLCESSFAWLNQLDDNVGYPLHCGLLLECVEIPADMCVDLTPLSRARNIKFTNIQKGKLVSNIFCEPKYDSDDDDDDYYEEEEERGGGEEVDPATTELTVLPIEPILPSANDQDMLQMNMKLLQEQQAIIERQKQNKDIKVAVREMKKIDKTLIHYDIEEMKSISFDVLPYLQAAKALRHLSFHNCPVVLDGQTILNELGSRPEMESISFTNCLGVTNFETLIDKVADHINVTARDMMVSPHLLPDRTLRDEAMKDYPIGNSSVLRQTLAACFSRTRDGPPPVRYETEREREIVAMGLNLIREEKEILCNNNKSCVIDWQHMSFCFASSQRRYDSNERWLCADSSCDIHWCDLRFREVNRIPCDIDTDPRPFNSVRFKGYRKGRLKRVPEKTYMHRLIRPKIEPQRSDLEVYRLHGACDGKTLFDMTNGQGARSCIAKRNYIFHYDTITHRWYGKYGGYYVDRCTECDRDGRIAPPFVKFVTTFLCEPCDQERN